MKFPPRTLGYLKKNLGAFGGDEFPKGSKGRPFSLSEFYSGVPSSLGKNTQGSLACYDKFPDTGYARLRYSNDWLTLILPRDFLRPIAT